MKMETELLEKIDPGICDFEHLLQKNQNQIEIEKNTENVYQNESQDSSEDETEEEYQSKQDNEPQIKAQNQNQDPLVVAARKFQVTPNKLLQDIEKKVETDIVNNSVLIPSEYLDQFQHFLVNQQSKTQLSHPQENKDDSDSDTDIDLYPGQKNENNNNNTNNNNNNKTLIIKKKEKNSNIRRSASKQRNKAKEKPLKISHLPLLNLKTITPDSAIAFTGKRKSGKTISIVNFVLAMSLPRVIIFGKGRDSAFWENYMDMMYIYEEWDVIKFKTIIAIQAQLLKLKKKPQFKNLDIRMTLILEDFSSDREVVGGKEITDLISNARRLQIFFLCSAQYLNSLARPVRTQFDGYALFKEKNQDVRKILYDAVGGYFGSKEEFYHFLDATTENRRCLFIDQGATNDESGDVAKHFTAKVISKPIRFGCFLYRMFAELFRKPPEEEEDNTTAPLFTEPAPPPVPVSLANLNNKLPLSEKLPIKILDKIRQKPNIQDVYVGATRKERHLIAFETEH